MIYKTETIQGFLASYNDEETTLRCYPTQSGTRYAVRISSNSDPNTGYAFVCAFASNIAEANRPAQKTRAAQANKAINELLYSPKWQSAHSVCYCRIDEASIEAGYATPDQLGQEYIIIAKSGTSTADCDYSKESNPVVKSD